MKKFLLIVGSVALIVFIIAIIVRFHFPLVSMEGFCLDVVWMISFAIGCFAICNSSDDYYLKILMRMQLDRLKTVIGHKNKARRCEPSFVS